ncbi:serine/threonine-protein kinase [Microseira wollei]|uniref:Serine/threonine protein kinase n=1 Tax=Microseira wollei NIES-4236 TaxID=2530354 RepID=A0AAV3WGI2_9CYAN|nr:serine/threonine-protein kinase [Microseira wollei]GET37524.1 serine/threonine protein kinase [Microseira wollei NIES-4236]
MFRDGQELQGGRYRIETILGRGGFGMTYKALHAEFNTHIVLKTPDPTLQNDPEYTSYVRKFRREGRLLTQLCQRCRHPHIVSVNDLFDEGNTPCLVMEFIPGENLFHLVRSRGKLPEAEAVQYIRQVASALDVVHREGIVHRDVHPGNIMLRSNSTGGNSVSAVLIDFGLAVEIVPISISSKLFGNPIFAPYELLNKKPGYSDPRVDIYTLAASLYYAVTGEYPTKAYDRRDGEELIPPQSHVASLSDELNRAIIAGMEFEAKKRPQSVSDWLALFPSQEDSEQVPARYQKLRDLLKAGKWKEADKETAKVMLQVAGREKEGWLDSDSIQNFPCEDLRAIDQLWVKYSNGRFGFSVQKRIWQEVGDVEDLETEHRLGDRLGWRVKDEWLNYNDLTFSLNAPLGHLPRGGGRWWVGGGWVVRAVYSVRRDIQIFFSRVETCKL